MNKDTLVFNACDQQRDEAHLSLLRYCTKTPAPRAKIMLQQNLFSFLLAGEKTVHYAGTQVTIKPHQFVLLAAGNCLMSEKTVAGNTDYRSILFFFDNILLADFFNRHAALLQSASKQVAGHPFLLFEKDDFLVNFTASLDCMLSGGKPVHHDLQKVKLEELLLYIAIQYPGQIQQISHLRTEANDDLIIRQAVTSHINSNITVEELAFLCNMSLSSFKRRFARIYGNSPNRWLLEKRMEGAAKMLRQDNRKASEIYYELGYENLSSFIQSFKQIYGITPKQYQLSN
ncbi:helix-turn-helix transcriptional regulator [Chitinophaga nivalis]|uniref:AraC family transcriptional regulator n=1 Tax=Chitinophaga nivalis TaxID=2991709 RepID=A0ABT3II80_9BACT|nr:AraC family transcriptional regulator [Chitinophaga nivalis]MCW3466667.1 AraC family transcriptional regulator [Chitinophaga nivalis]MCW3483642.1 AraC family transcriptional regulator [Chitinophaga nivalis]